MTSDNPSDAGVTRRLFLSATAALTTGTVMAPQQTRAQAPVANSAAPLTANETLSGRIWDLVAANRILAAHEVVDGYGHVSARSPVDTQRYFISGYMAPEAVTPDDLIELDLDSNAIDGRGRPMQSERYIHGGIYRVRPDVGAVVHFHAPPVVLMSVCGEPMRPVYHMAGFVGQGVPLFDTRNVAGMTNLLISNLSLGRALGEALGDKPAILLRGHGAVVVGKDLAEACGRAVYLMINAQLQGQLLGHKVEYLSDEEARLADSQNGYPKDWELWKAKAMANYR
jgi:HCOMODA/2-hydroxy-3-carboxy-muconic semialdehyde decarboxylase